MLGRDVRLRFPRMTMMLTHLTAQRESALGELLSGLITQFGGAIEFWTLVCLSQRELGNPTIFVDRQWISLRERIQEFRERLAEDDYDSSPAVQEQVAKLASVAAELREVFNSFIDVRSISQKDLEAAVLKLAHIWQDVRMRIWLLGTLIPLAQPPALSMEQEAYYQTILDALFDQFMALRAAAADAHERNGISK
jgi:hypothetical protein